MFLETRSKSIHTDAQQQFSKAGNVNAYLDLQIPRKLLCINRYQGHCVELQSSRELSGSSDIFQQKNEKIKLLHFSCVYLPF